ncbi:hypothetical protein VNI00_003930 [Paramarasmius palmivorus]|uniref:DUF6534 domain-containing protein n=1 Tax=Paramarasmius palmivorus TaxID=297713 RepID=A0AAW0DPD4_9AGAR
MASAITDLPALDNTMGALFIGVLFAAALWGIVCFQTWCYYKRQDYPSDPIRLKVMVGTTLVLDTTHQVMLCHLLYTYLITNYGKPVVLGELIWSILIMVLLTSFIALIVQLFLTWRIWILSHKNRPVTVLILLLIFAEFGVTIAYFGRSWPMTTYLELKQLSVISRVVNALGAASDVAITVSLSFYLWTSKSGMKNTDAIMDRLILFCIRTGLLTTVCAILSLITITVWPDTFIYITFYSTLARFYSTSFLTTLNARAELRASNKTGNGNTFIGSVSLTFDPPGSTTIDTSRSQDMRSVAHRERRITIKQDVDTIIHSDSDFELEQDTQIGNHAV